MGGEREERLGNLSLMILCYVTGGAEVKVWSVEHTSLPLKPCKRQSIQSVLLTVYKVLETMPLGAQVKREYQSTGITEGRHQNEQSFDCIPITVLTKSVAIKDLIIYLHRTM